jgi:hypothetical protein
VFGRVLVLVQTVTRHQLAIGTDRAVAMSLSDAPLGSRSADTLNKATTSVIMYATRHFSACFVTLLHMLWRALVPSSVAV